MKLRILPEADDEAFSAAIWYADQREGLGEEFNVEYLAALESIRKNPRRYSIVEPTRAGHEVRCYRLHRFPYLIFYDIRADEVVVLAVAHGSRRPKYWRKRRNK